MRTCLIDIRATARPESEILHMAPEFKAPSNYKDAEKIAAHIAGQKAEWLDKAAFSALTGRVLAVGSRRNGQSDIMDGEDEGGVLLDLWAGIESCINERRKIVGFDIYRQKLPFAARRSWALGVPVPEGLFPPDEEFFIDLLEQWRCGDKHEHVSLSTLGKFLGIELKAAAPPAFASTRAGAVASLTNDLLLTEQIMQRMIPGTEAGVAAKNSPPAVAFVPTVPASPSVSPKAERGSGGAETLSLETLSLTTDDY